MKKSNNEDSIFDKLIEQYMEFHRRFTSYIFDIEKQKTIFDPLPHPDAVATRAHGGPSLGLAISRRMAEALGGRLWVDSEPGKGSCFHFTIPLKRQKAETICDHREKARLLDHLSILVVSDKTSGPGLIKMLANWGIEIDIAFT